MVVHLVEREVVRQNNELSHRGSSPCNDDWVERLMCPDDDGEAERYKN